jgi:hypothetical protein
MEDIYDTEAEIADEAALEKYNGEVKQLPEARIDKDTVIANMKAQQEIFAEFLNYVKSNLTAKIDYYTVVQGAKPSLGQTGAEKILDFLRIYPKFVVTHRVLSKSEISYDVTCNLYSKVDGRQLGSGGGFCSSMEDNYLYEWVYEKYLPKTADPAKLEQKKRKGKDGNWFVQYRLELQNHYNVANTVKKMALKRAMVDACVRSTFASHIFTQDLEDSYIGTVVARQNVTAQPPKNAPQGTSKASNPQNNTNTQANPQNADLDPNTYIFNGGKFAGKRPVDAEMWWLEGQIKWIIEGKFDDYLAKANVDKSNYLEMFQSAIDIKKALSQAASEDNLKSLDKEYDEISFGSVENGS